MTWTHRDRVLAALNHEQPDRVPIDFGSTFVSTIYLSAYDRLKEHLGFDHETVVMSKRRGLAQVHPSILERFDADARYLSLGPPDGDAEEQANDSYVDAWGTTWRNADDGHYLYVDGPFFNQKKPSIDDIERLEWPDPDNPGYVRGLAERAAALRRDTDCAIVLNLPLGVVHQGQFVRGFGDWLKDLYKNPDFICRFMDVCADYFVRLSENALDCVGDNVDVVMFGDDLGTQMAPMFSPDKYRELVKPRHRRMVEALKAKTQAKVMLHSCGSIEPMLEDIIEIGVDAVNPVQVSATGMAPEHLKEAYGDRLTFWGGIDTQDVLPFGDPDAVRGQVRRMIDSMGTGGGYVLNSVHNLQADVPPENIVAMFDEARTYESSG
jgi:uroporphyrinogen decarboxylase